MFKFFCDERQLVVVRMTSSLRCKWGVLCIRRFSSAVVSLGRGWAGWLDVQSGGVWRKDRISELVPSDHGHNFQNLPKFCQSFKIHNWAGRNRNVCAWWKWDSKSTFSKKKKKKLDLLNNQVSDWGTITWIPFWMWTPKCWVTQHRQFPTC